jgi:hypothetical protein
VFSRIRYGSWFALKQNVNNHNVRYLCVPKMSYAHTSTQDILNIYTQLFNLFNSNFNYQHTTRCLDCGEYVYKQLHLGRMHYVLCNSAP